MSDTDKIDDVEKQAEDTKAEDSEAKQAEWDKKRQEAEQNAAVAKAEAQRARAEAEEYASALADTQDKMAELEAKIEQQQEAIGEQKDELREMDPDIVDRSVIDNVKALEAKLASLTKEHSELKSKATEYERSERDKIEKAHKEEAINDVLTSVESQLADEEITQQLLSGDSPAKFRNAAIKVADELVDSGKEKQPKTGAQGVRLMRKCYLQVIKQARDEKKKSVPTDSGGGGVPHQPETKKRGTRAEVLADMKKTGSWKT